MRHARDDIVQLGCGGRVGGVRHLWKVLGPGYPSRVSDESHRTPMGVLHKGPREISRHRLDVLTQKSAVQAARDKVAQPQRSCRASPRRILANLLVFLAQRANQATQGLGSWVWDGLLEAKLAKRRAAPRGPIAIVTIPAGLPRPLRSGPPPSSAHTAVIRTRATARAAGLLNGVS